MNQMIWAALHIHLTLKKKKILNKTKIIGFYFQTLRLNQCYLSILCNYLWNLQAISQWKLFLHQCVIFDMTKKQSFFL